ESRGWMVAGTKPREKGRAAVTTPAGPFLFFGAEDGIRAYKVTGVQTCALPIYGPTTRRSVGGRERARARPVRRGCTWGCQIRGKIGRASGRERGENARGAVTRKETPQRPWGCSIIDLTDQDASRSGCAPKRLRK